MQCRVGGTISSSRRHTSIATALGASRGSLCFLVHLAREMTGILGHLLYSSQISTDLTVWERGSTSGMEQVSSISSGTIIRDMRV
jgi:hypothetical protein